MIFFYTVKTLKPLIRCWWKRKKSYYIPRTVRPTKSEFKMDIKLCALMRETLELQREISNQKIEISNKKTDIDLRNRIMKRLDQKIYIYDNRILLFQLYVFRLRYRTRIHEKKVARLLKRINVHFIKIVNLDEKIRDIDEKITSSYEIIRDREEETSYPRNNIFLQREKNDFYKYIIYLQKKKIAYSHKIIDNQDNQDAIIFNRKKEIASIKEVIPR